MRDHNEWSQPGTCCCSGLIGFSPQSALVSATTVIAWYSSVSWDGLHMSTISSDLLGCFYGIYEFTFGQEGEIWKDIFRPQASMCVCVFPILLSSPLTHECTNSSKYKYGNAGQSVCVCICVLVSGHTGGSSLPRWSAQIKCQSTAWVAEWYTYTGTHTHSFSHTSVVV